MQKMLMLAGGAALAFVVAGGAWLATRSAAPVPAVAQSATAPGALPAVSAADHVLGKPDAPITIVEYASMTCPACAQFHVRVLPEVKKKWIDSGKARLVFRDFPLDRIAVQAAQIAECSGAARYFGVVEALFQTQGQWSAAPDATVEFARILRIAGIGEAEIKACLADDKIQTAILQERQAGEAAGVTATPTLFLNGVKYAGNRTFEDLDAQLAKLAK